MTRYKNMWVQATKPYLFTTALFIKDKYYMSTKTLAVYLSITKKRASLILLMLGWVRHSEVSTYTVFTR